MVITSVSNLNAQSTDEILKKGIEFREKGDLDESLEILKQAEKQDKNNSEILYQIALTYISKDEIESVNFRYGNLKQMISQYNPSKLKDGFNDNNGEQIYFISNPSLGLWSCKERFNS